MPIPSERMEGKMEGGILSFVRVRETERERGEGLSVGMMLLSRGTAGDMALSFSSPQLQG